MDHNDSSANTRVDQSYQAGIGSDAARSNNSAKTLAIIALVVSLTAPFWEEAVLGSINIHLPLAREQAETARAVDQLERKTGNLEQQLNATTVQLAKLQTQLNQTMGRANVAAESANILALVDLGAALRRSGSFDLELAAVRTATQNQGDLKPLLDKIEPYAVTGVPNQTLLRQDFARISGRSSWSLRGLVPIAWVTRILPWQRGAASQPAAPADNTPELLSQINAQLLSGDLAGAVATAQLVTGPRQEALADWIEDANARIAADTVVQRINEQIAQRAGKSTAQGAKSP